MKGSRTLTRKQVAYAIEQQKKGVSQTRLAMELGCSQNAISRAVKEYVPLHPRRRRYDESFPDARAPLCEDADGANRARARRGTDNRSTLDEGTGGVTCASCWERARTRRLGLPCCRVCELLPPTKLEAARMEWQRILESEKQT